MIGRAHEASTGYRPPLGGVSMTGFLLWISVYAVAIAIPELVGSSNVGPIFRLCISAIVVGLSSRDIVHPLRNREEATEVEYRNARLWSIVLLIAFTSLGTLAIHDLLRPE